MSTLPTSFYVRKFILALFSVLSSVLGFEKVQRPTHVNILQCNDKNKCNDQKFVQQAKIDVMSGKQGDHFKLHFNSSFHMEV